MCLGPKKGAVSGVSQLELGNKGINFEDHGKNRTFTPQKFNMEPEDDGFQKESPLQGGHFQVLCLFWGV